MDLHSFRRAELGTPEAAEHDRVFGLLARRSRELIDAQLRTEVDHAEAEEIAAELEVITARLLKQARTEPLGVEYDDEGRSRAHGNAVVGLRNPVAPPLKVERSEEGRAWSSFHLNALYEGPPGLVHGGVCALILDQLLGEAASSGGSPGMTASLTLTYRRPTPLGELSAEAWIERVDGIKTIAKGHLKDADGEPTVEAEGLFILPRWAREAMAEDERKRVRFD